MSKGALYITGHRNPDSDSICSAIAYARLKQELQENAVAIRCGEINEETKFILEYFNEDAPPLVHDMRTRIRDIEFDEACTIGENGTVYQALEIMRKHNKKVIAIVNEQQNILGMATVSDINNSIVCDDARKKSLIQQIPLNNIADILQGRLVYQSSEDKRNGEIAIATSVEGDFSYDDYNQRIIITSSRQQTQANAIRGNCAVVIATKSKEASLATLELAKKHNCSVIITPLDMYAAACAIERAIPLKLIMTQDLTGFKYDEYVDEVKTRINKSRFRSYPVLDASNRLVGFISRYHLFKHVNRRLILVDHNEVNQSILGADQAEIVEIIDHHRLGGLQTTYPIIFRNELFGSCATIIAGLYEENQVKLSKSTAGILCSAIISDTVNFNSPTCTKDDILTATKLAKIAEVDIETLAKQILEASLTISKKSIEDIIYNDLKVFDIEEYKVSIGQINIGNYESIAHVYDEVCSYLHKFRRSNKFDYCIMVFTLIDGTGSYIIESTSEIQLLKLAFESTITMKDQFYFIGDVVSRKKQIVPQLTNAAYALHNSDH